MHNFKGQKASANLWEKLPLFDISHKLNKYSDTSITAKTESLVFKLLKVRIQIWDFSKPRETVNKDPPKSTNQVGTVTIQSYNTTQNSTAEGKH